MTTARRLGACLLALWVLPPGAALAEDAYPVARIDRTALVRMPAAIEEFTRTLRLLQAEAAFAAGAGIAPRADLGGLGAKAWLLAHVAPDFRCLSDFGGMCPDVTGPHAHIARFLARFRSSDDPAMDFAAIARDGVPDLGPVGLAMPVLMQDQTWLSLEEGLLCTPQARSAGLAGVEAALTGHAGGDLLHVLGHLRAVVGRYNIRAEPRIDAPVLTRSDDWVLYLADPDTVIEEPRDGALPYRWSEVLLPDGRHGFIAPAPGDLLDAGGLGEQVCYSGAEGTALIQVHVGGGD